jgi:hypothetical protein
MWFLVKNKIIPKYCTCPETFSFWVPSTVSPLNATHCSAQFWQNDVTHDENGDMLLTLGACNSQAVVLVHGNMMIDVIQTLMSFDDNSSVSGRRRFFINAAVRDNSCFYDWHCRSLLPFPWPSATSRKEQRVIQPAAGTNAVPAAGSVSSAMTLTAARRK